MEQREMPAEDTAETSAWPGTYKVPGTGGMKFICNRWVFTGGQSYVKVERNESWNGWIVCQYYCTGVFDTVVSFRKGMTEDEAHEYAATYVKGREPKEKA